jgi:hypothetical protein
MEAILSPACMIPRKRVDVKKEEKIPASTFERKHD